MTSSEEIASEAGTNAGKAAKIRDWATAQFHIQKFNLWILEQPEEKNQELRVVFNEAYRVASMRGLDV